MPGGSRPAGGRWPTAGTRVAGVVGDPIRHSLSPLLCNAVFDALGLDWVMLAFPVPAGRAAEALGGMRAFDVAGLSVTMPLKTDMAHLVDECTPTAAALQAVNSICRIGDRLVGDNTDGAGLLASLRRRADFDPAGHRCMVVGAGGAARAVVLALAEAGAAEVVVVNRTPARAEVAAALAGSNGRVGTAAEAGEMDLVVDATPAGMAGAAGPGSFRPLVEPAQLGPGQLVADLVYHPVKTEWLAAAERRGAEVVGGLGMLVHQAAIQLAWWTGEPVPVEVMWDAARQAVDGPPPG